jgi:hypothetical protein
MLADLRTLKKFSQSKRFDVAGMGQAAVIVRNIPSQSELYRLGYSLGLASQ